MAQGWHAVAIVRLMVILLVSTAASSGASDEDVSEALESTPSPQSGTRVSSLTLPTLGMIAALAVDNHGTVYMGTDSAVYFLTPAGVLELHAGNPTSTGFKDGKGPKVFDICLAIACTVCEKSME